jgi:hypothetical protein
MQYQPLKQTEVSKEWSGIMTRPVYLGEKTLVAKG